MTLIYEEFETTSANLVSDLATRILTHPDWSDQGVVNVSSNTTAALSTSGSTATVANGALFAIGDFVVVNPGASNEFRRTVTNVVGNVLTMNANNSVAFASGTPIATVVRVLKCTTTRGAKMIVDLGGAPHTPHASFGINVYNDYAGTTPRGGIEPKQFYIWYRSGALQSAVITVTLSVSKEHIYIALEGPKPWQAGPTSTTYGSLKNCFAMSDLVPYHDEDVTPSVVAIGNSMNSSTPAVTADSHQASINYTHNGLSPWHAVRLATLTFPSIYSSDIVPVNRQCGIDGNTYLLPYVVFSEIEGIRGRLARFFYANTNAPSPPTDYPDPVGTRVDYDGITYRMNTPYKGDGTLAAWGPFGSVLNTGGSAARTVIVAVPRAEVVP